MRIKSRSLVRLVGEQRGIASEEVANQMIQELICEGKIREVIKTERFSWLDYVSKVDCVIIRLSGKAVPQQFKSSYFSVLHFKERHRQFFMKRFGALPVVMDFPPGISDWEEKKKMFLKRINNWQGRFRFQERELKYSKFFDFKKYPQFGSQKNRIKLFFRHRHEMELKMESKKELISNSASISTPQLS
ncbi:MAG: hypothetical protein AAB522_00920 [Patescibacteria group bacterium]